MDKVSSSPERPREASRPVSAPTMLGAAVAFLGAVFVVSLYLSSLRTATPDAGFVPMQYNTALGFVVTGAAVVAYCLGRRRLAFWGGAAAAGLGSMALAEHLLGRSLHLVDALFGGSFVGPAGHSMSANTALCFALAGCVLITLRAPGASARWRQLATGVLASCLVASGVVGLLAFINNDGGAYGWARMTEMNAHTALGFVGLGTAFFVMIVRLKEAPTVTALPSWAPWTVGLGVAALSFTLWASLTSSDARMRNVAATRMHEAALAHTNQLMQSHLRTLKRLSVRCEDTGGDGSDFRRDAKAYLAELPGLTNVGWVDPDGNVTFSVGNLDARDLQTAIADRSEVRSALHVASEENLTSASNPVGLSGEKGDLFVFVPVQRRGDFRGAVVYVHAVAPFFDWIFGEGVGRAFDVQLATLKGDAFYHSRLQSSLNHDDKQAGAASATGATNIITTGRVAFADQVWELAGEADGSWIAGGRNAGSTLILWFGLFLAVALAFVIRKSELVRQRASSLDAAKRTIEEHAESLRRANESLQQSQADLTGAAREKRRVLDSLSAFLIGVDQDGRIVEWNSVASQLFGLTDEQTLGRRFDQLSLPWDTAMVSAAVSESLASGERVRRESVTVDAGPDTNRSVSITVNPTQTESGRGFALIGSDVTERQMLEMQLHHAQRLESVGTLAAGIAHEINTPMQFVSDNLRFVSQSVGPLSGLLQLLPEMLAAAESGKVGKELAARLAVAAEGLDVAFLAEELPAALGETQEGVSRVTTIVRAMKDFSHPGNQGRKSADLNKAIATTLAVARNEYKYVAEIETDFGDLPEIECYVADLNQVFLNLLVNAAHAIKDVVGNTGAKGTIRIRTRVDGDHIEIRFADSGTGIPEHARAKIFDQFFTTKEIGRGTGLGLAIARAVVVDKHKGSIDFETETGKGTTFIVRIPVVAQGDEAAAGAPGSAGSRAPRAGAGA